MVLRIAMVAPPWIAVPPPGYGGIEVMVHLLTDGLVALGHEVTLFAAPGSRSRAIVQTVLPAALPNSIGATIHEVDHVVRVLEMIDQAAAAGRPFDVIHDNTGGWSLLGFADRVRLPIVHTVHGPFEEATAPFYEKHGSKARLVCISQSQRASGPATVAGAAVIANPIRIDDWTLQPRGGFLLWIGRFAPIKGAHLAVAAAKAAGRKLILAGPIQPGQKHYFDTAVAPHVDGVDVSYVGEVGAGTTPSKRDLFAQADGVLVPIQWAEPFGIVMVEAGAAGTPVIAFAQGAAPEVVIDGQTGFLVKDLAGMVAAIPRLASISPAVCRASVAGRFDVRAVAAAYEAAYR